MEITDGRPAPLTTARVRGPAELLATLPYLLGYVPDEALVVVGLEDGRAALTQRADLPDEDDPDEVLGELAARLVRSGAQSAVVVAYGADPARAEHVASACREALERQWLRVGEVVVVTDGQWRSLTCLEGCCDQPRPVPAPDRVPAVAELVAAGRSPLPSRDALAGLVWSPEGDPDAVLHAGEQLLAQLRDLGLVGDPGREELVRRSLTDWAALLRGQGVDDAPEDWDPHAVARAGLSLEEVTWRDALVAVVCPDLLPVDLGDARVPGWLDAMGAAQVGPGERARARGRLAALVRRLPDAYVAPAATVLAAAAWSDGDGALAGDALARALAVRPDYRLARLLTQVIAAGIPPRPLRGADGASGGAGR